MLSPNKDGGWNMCTNYRVLNNIIIRYQFPFPYIDDFIDYLSGASLFSRIDSECGYHHIRVREGDEWNSTFKTTEGLYEWMVIPFGFSNAPSTFMRLMNAVLKEFIVNFVIFYLNDILVYCQSNGEHLEHLRYVLNKLQQEKLLINLKKCSFLKPELVYLGFFICREELRMDTRKVKVIVEWRSPRNIFEVICFHGLESFYRKFIRNFNKMSA